MPPLFGFLDLPAPTQLIVLLVLAVLLFGRDLPKVARTWGQKLAEFKRGLKGIEDEIRSIAADNKSPAQNRSAIEEDSSRADLYEHDKPADPTIEPPSE